MKRFLTVLLAVSILCSLVGTAMANDMDDLFDFMYVNCANGKTLNLRDAPNGKKIGSIECGTKVYITGGFISADWVHVTLLDGREGFVKNEYLQSKKPGKYEITEREDNFIHVRRPYIVNAKALNAKTDRSVGLRIKPNKTSKAYRRLEAGDQLEVLSEGKTWLQVLDLTTGDIGYVADDYMEFDHYVDEESEGAAAPVDTEME